MKKLSILVLAAITYGLLSAILVKAYAKEKELTLIYTGETHASLYHCSCPIEPDGGVARRATLIKKIKKEYPDALVLDSGSFFGAGTLDQNSQSAQLDMQRTMLNLKAMELMGYDALALSDDEFNFGKEALEDNLAQTKLKFISSNLKLDKTVPYLIKEISDCKVGIIALTNSGAKRKAQTLELIEPKKALENSLQEVKKQGATLVILLSNLGESEDLRLIETLPGIDILIDGRARGNKEPFIKVGNTLVLRPSWQGRRLGEAVLNIKAGRIANFSVKELRVSDKINDDPDVLTILPRCFSDNDCKKEGLIGECRIPGSTKSICMFTEPNKINLTVITSKDCSTCNPQGILNFFKQKFPGLSVSYLYYPDKKAAKLVEDYKISGLPAYLFGKELAKDRNFDTLKSNLFEKDDFYMLKPEAGGINYFLGRKRIQGRLDLFISLFDKNSFEVLNVIKEFNPAVHLLSIVSAGKIETMHGNMEIEENLRSVCVQKYYPRSFWDYITCRAKNINSSWWEDCAAGMDTNKIKVCARSDEGKSLLEEDNRLSKEVKIMFGPTYLLDNNEVFSSKGAPSKEELNKIIKK